VDFWIPKPNPNAAPAAKPVDDFDDDDIPF